MDRPDHGQPHTCRNSYLMHQSDPHPRLTDVNRPELTRINPELAELARLNPELSRFNPELARINPELARLNPELALMSPEMAHMTQMAPVAHYQPEVIQEMSSHLPDARFNTLRGHLVPYGCQRIGMSASNLHRDCRLPDDNITIECLHQKTGSKGMGLFLIYARRKNEYLND